MATFIKKAIKVSIYGIVFVFLVGASTVTPIFATVVGGGLSLIGDWYGGTWDTDNQPPQAYVILGGGLTTTKNNDITLNRYSYKRTQTLWQAWQTSPLPIITSGVESPWISESLAYFFARSHKKTEHQTQSTLEIHQENASMNTCENARFSAKLIAHDSSNGTLPTVVHIYLISDWYHMARARRQFAQVGLSSTPLIAPMPSDMGWHNPKSNLNHSRRAFYEAVALLRDIIYPQKNCRIADEVGIDTIKKSRRQDNLHTF